MRPIRRAAVVVLVACLSAPAAAAADTTPGDAPPAASTVDDTPWVGELGDTAPAADRAEALAEGRPTAQSPVGAAGPLGPLLQGELVETPLIGRHATELRATDGFAAFEVDLEDRYGRAPLVLHRLSDGAVVGSFREAYTPERFRWLTLVPGHAVEQDNALVVVRDLATSAEVDRFEVPAGQSFVAWSPEGTVLLERDAAGVVGDLLVHRDAGTVRIPAAGLGVWWEPTVRGRWMAWPTSDAVHLLDVRAGTHRTIPLATTAWPRELWLTDDSVVVSWVEAGENHLVRTGLDGRVLERVTVRGGTWDTTLLPVGGTTVALVPTDGWFSELRSVTAAGALGDVILTDVVDAAVAGTQLTVAVAGPEPRVVTLAEGAARPHLVRTAPLVHRPALEVGLTGDRLLASTFANEIMQRRPTDGWTPFAAGRLEDVDGSTVLARRADDVLVARWPGGERAVGRLWGFAALGDDGDAVLRTAQDGTLLVEDTRTGAVLSSGLPGQSLFGYALDGGRLWSVAPHDDRLVGTDVRGTADPLVVRVPRCQEREAVAAVRVEGRWAVLQCPDGRAWAVDLLGEVRTRTLALGAVDRIGSGFVTAIHKAAGDEPASIQVVDLATGASRRYGPATTWHTAPDSTGLPRLAYLDDRRLPRTVELDWLGTVTPSPPGLVRPVDPQRIHSDPRVPPGTPRCVQVTGRAGVPAGATGTMLTVATVRPAAPGNVVVYPDTKGDGTTPVPKASTVNFEVGADVTGTTFVALPPSGRVCYATTSGSTVGLHLDLTGYTLAGSGVELRTPVRVMDTRDPAWGHPGPVSPAETFDIDVTAGSGIPAGAAAVVLSVAVPAQPSPGNVKVFPYGTTPSTTSTVNFAPGQDKANLTVVPLDGATHVSVDVDSPGSAHVVVDVLGWVEVGSPLVPVAPTRALDTRPTSRVGDVVGPLTRRQEYTLPLHGRHGIPVDATAVVLTVTAVQPTHLGHLRVYPDASGSTPPDISTVNYIPGRDVANTVVVPLGADGRVAFWSDQFSGSAHVVADVVGYVQD